MKSSLRLLLLNYEFPPLGGGAGNATYYMGLELRKLGHRVDVLTAREQGGKAFEEMDGVRVWRVPSYRLGVHEAGLRGAASYLIFARLKLAQLMRENDYDLLHYYFGLPTGLLALYSHAKRGVPYIVSLRGSDVPGYDADAAPSFHRLLGSIRQRIWHNAAAVVANSGSLRDLALNAGADRPIEVIPNGVNTQRFSPPRSRRSEGRPLRVISVSRLIQRKGLETLLHAVASLGETDLQLEIIGTGKLEAQVRALIRARGLEGRVRLAGFVGQAELAERYRRADLFVLTSLSESCAMALLEAMSSGLPVIVSKVGGNTEIVAPGENGLLFEPGSSSDLTSALRKLAEAPELRAAMSENNVKKIQSRHAWPRIAQQYEGVYQRALGAEVVESPVMSRCCNL